MADLGTTTGRRRLRIRAVAIVVALLIGLAAMAACLDLFRFSAEHNRRLIDALPARARTAYLDAVFDRPIRRARGAVSGSPWRWMPFSPICCGIAAPIAMTSPHSCRC